MGGLAAGQLPLGTAEDDGVLLDELERHVWSRRRHAVLIGLVEMLQEEAPVQRLWALLTGLMIGAQRRSRRLHAMLMVNTLSHSRWTSARQRQRPARTASQRV